MQLIVRNLEGTHVIVSITPVTRFYDVKRFATSHNLEDAVVRRARLRFSGRWLPDSARVLSWGLKGDETIDLVLPLCGGGGDGGATGAESRDCYLNMYAEKKPEKLDPKDARFARWTSCLISGEPLTPPCVIDYLGNIFNKDAVIEALVTKSLPPSMVHIRGLKDIIAIHLAEIPAVDADSAVRFQCPITGQEFNGNSHFVALKKCGHVLAARALKEIGGDSCLVCHKPFAKEDKIVINGSEEEVEVLRERMERERKHKGKGSKKGETKERHSLQDHSDQRSAGQMLTGVGLSVSAMASKAGGASVELHSTEGKKVSGKKRHLSSQESERLSRPKGCDLVGRQNKFNAVKLAPDGANKDVFASIFLSSSKEGPQETYMCRNLPLARN